MSVVTVTSLDNKDCNNVMVGHNKDNEVHLSLSTGKLIERQKDNTFCTSIFKVLNEKEPSSPQTYFVNYDELLHKAVREDAKIFLCASVTSSSH